MKTLSMMVALTLAGAAMAQNTPPKPAVSPDAGKVIISQGQTVAVAVAGMAKLANATVVVDPALNDVKVTPAVAKLSLQPGLAAIANANHAQWRKAYLKEAEIPKKADGTIDPVKIRSIVETATSIPDVTVGVYEPAKGQISMTTRAPATSPGTVKWLEDKKVIYVLYRPAIVSSALGQTGDIVADYLATQRNSMDAFRNMSPEQRAQAMRQGMEMVLNMDPKIMGQMAQESMAALQNLSPEQKAKLFDMGTSMMGGGNQPKSVPQ